MTKHISPTDRKRLADLVGMSEQYLYQCLTGRREMGAQEAVRVERATAGEITRRDVCTKTYAAIWPELATPTPAEQGVAHG